MHPITLSCHVSSSDWQQQVSQMPAMSMPQFSSPNYNQATVYRAPEFKAPPLPTERGPGTGLITGTVKAFIKDDLPPQAKTVGTFVSAAIAGHKLADNVTKAENEGQTKAEAWGCQTARTITQEVTGKVVKGAIVGGIPTYLLAASTPSPLTLTVPFVLPLIPTAYQGAEMLAHAVGNATEDACHSAFEAARRLTKGK